MGISHDAQDAHDAAARKRLDHNSRKPIRYDLDTWLVMRDDPVLPAAVIRRIRHSGGESFIVVTWDLEPGHRLMTGRYPTLQEADKSVLYVTGKPVVPHPNEDIASVERRRQDHARQEAEAQNRAVKRYGA